MASYWAGYSGAGMVLTSQEFYDMLEVYKEKNPGQKEAVEEHVENGDVEMLPYIKSVNAGEAMPDLVDNESKYEGKLAYISEQSDDNVDGFTFTPFYRPDGRMNVTERHGNAEYDEAEYHHIIWEANDDRCYVCWSDKSFTSPKVFEERPYASYDEFVQEFKDKWAAYLPEDFDWNAHLGYMSYACYA